MLQSSQAMVAAAFLTVGALIVFIGSRQEKARNISRIPIVSPRAKHVVGLLLIFAAITIFLSQFITRK